MPNSTEKQQTASHDAWFREQVEMSLAEANDQAAEWITNQEANASWERKRAELQARLNTEDKGGTC